RSAWQHPALDGADRSGGPVSRFRSAGEHHTLEVTDHTAGPASQFCPEPGYPASEGVDHAAESASHLDGTDHPAGSASRFRSVPRHPVLDRTDHASEKLRQEEADGRELSESIPPFRPVARRMESGRTEPLPVMRGPARGFRNNQGVGGACDLSEADPQESARNEAGVADSASVLPAAGETVA